MFSTVFVFILLFIYFDGRILRRRNRKLYHEHFSPRGWILALWCAALLMAPFFPQGLEYFAAFFFIFVFPGYLVQRRRLERVLRGREPALTPETDVLPLVSDTVGIILYWFLGMIAAEVLITLAAGRLVSELAKSLVMSLFSFLWVIYLVSRTVREYPHISLKEIFGLRREGLSSWRLWVFPLLLGIAAAGISSYIIQTRAFQPVTPLTDLIDSTRSVNVVFFFLILAVTLAPFFEEVVFRGFLFYVLKKFKGTVLTIFVIAGLFGAMHCRQYWQDWEAILVVTALGFLLTGLRAWTGSSVPGMVVHYVYNFLMVFIPVLTLLVSNPSYYEYQARMSDLTYPQREELLLESIRENPRHAASYNDLAWTYAEEGKDLNEALRLVNRALELDPGRFQILDTKAEILYRMGRVEEAAAIAEGLVERLPKNEYASKQLEKFRGALPAEKTRN